jgi:hypothetical protein
MTTLNKTLLRLVIGLLLCISTPRAHGVTLEELRNDSKLTPARFARYFADFTFEYHDQVQAPETFLSTQSGDCDDFATLAATILGEKGYTTHLISVRMANETHVVCYVEETKCYLDYNIRGCLFRTVSSDGSLNNIARKVAKSFDAKWTSAAEFTYAQGVKHLVNTLLADGVHTNPSVQFAAVSTSTIKVDF